MVLHNAHPKRNIGFANRGEPSEAISGKPLMSEIIFRRIGSHYRFSRRGLYLQMDEWLPIRNLCKELKTKH